ncbi:hypothetical protein OG204_00470 [Streptomyces sp. NBC_01387]|uniref:hypothetical protein n=1 Tax=Streptomyces sp. NBC_01387 TaxID=2903849 RepID=UPI003254B1A1
MTRMWPPGGGTRRPLAPRVAASGEPVNPARIGRRVVRRRAKGMDVSAVLAAEAAAAAAREGELCEAARIAARADELQALRELGTLEQAEPREGDEAVRDELTRRAGGYVQGDVDAWLAHALAVHLGHYRDPAARERAASLLSPPLLAHAALLTELAHLAPGAGVDQLAFAARLATTETEAASALAVFLARARSDASLPHPAQPPRSPRSLRETWEAPGELGPEMPGSSGMSGSLRGCFPRQMRPWEASWESGCPVANDLVHGHTGDLRRPEELRR